MELDVLNSLRNRIKELEAEVLRIKTESSRDRLTGCLRREAFQDLIQSRKEFGLLPKHSTLLVIDLDHFKKINDTYGHLVGDRVLAQVGEILRELVPEGSIVARFGGEEFAVLLECSASKGFECAERLRKAIQDSKIKINLTQSLQATVSIGLALWDTDAPFESAFAEADEALYAAKKGGRNQVAA